MANTEQFQSPAPFSTWVGVVLLFALFGVIVVAVIGPGPRGDTYERMRAEERVKKLKDVRDEAAKALTTYAKANPAFTFRAGFVEGRVIDIKSITELASMPSKEEILSKLLFLINAPAQRLLTAMNAVGRNLAVVIDQGCKENKFQ